MAAKRAITVAIGGCAVAAVLTAPAAAADNGNPGGPGQAGDNSSQGSLVLPDKHGARHVLRQDQTVGGANPDVPYGTNPFGKDDDTVIGGADPSVPDGSDPLVPYGTWQN